MLFAIWRLRIEVVSQVLLPDLETWWLTIVFSGVSWLVILSNFELFSGEQKSLTRLSQSRLKKGGGVLYLMVVMCS